jgi:hypothetical protein
VILEDLDERLRKKICKKLSDRFGVIINEHKGIGAMEQLNVLCQSGCVENYNAKRAVKSSPITVSDTLTGTFNLSFRLYRTTPKKRIGQVVASRVMPKPK